MLKSVKKIFWIIYELYYVFHLHVCCKYDKAQTLLNVSLNTHSTNPICSKHNCFSFPTPFSFKLLVCFFM